MVRLKFPVPLKRYVVPVTAEAGVNVRDETPGCTTTEATYDDETKPIDSDTFHVPIALVGEPAYEPVALGIVSNVKYADAWSGLLKANVFNPDRFSPIEPVPYSCDDV
jgi:hypothetical protein